jgi:hypothetical protein
MSSTRTVHNHQHLQDHIFADQTSSGNTSREHITQPGLTFRSTNRESSVDFIPWLASQLRRLRHRALGGMFDLTILAT